MLLFIIFPYTRPMSEIQLNLDLRLINYLNPHNWGHWIFIFCCCNYLKRKQELKKSRTHPKSIFRFS